MSTAMSLVTLACLGLIVGAAGSTLPAATLPRRFHLIADVTNCQGNVNISVMLDDLPAELLLVESVRDFLSPSLEFDSPRGSIHARSACFYQGVVADQPDSLAVVTINSGVVSGSVSSSSGSYDIPSSPLSSQPLRCPKSPPRQKRTCALGGDIKPDLSSRAKRALRQDVHSSVTPAERKFISLVLVGDAYYYGNRSRNLTAAENRLWEIGNYINALYKQLGVNVLIVKTLVWTEQPYELKSAGNAAGANSTEMLDRFMEYRMRHLTDRRHTAAHQISGLKMTGTDVGLAHLGKLCQFSLGGGVNSDLDDSALDVAITVAHELGHNLGMNHDEDDPPCNCPDSQGCIMAAVGGQVNPLKFAACSVRRYLEFSVDNGLGYCMKTPPDEAMATETRAMCGNRIVEAGEQCDCGLPGWCNNTCCNPSTCTFANSATCASGTCCDLDTCSLKPSGTTCREAKDSCDLPEFCNGTSEWCPEFDDHKIDGTVCAGDGSHCYAGSCADRGARCSALFGNTNVGASPAAWSVGTTRGNRLGYCGYNLASVAPLNYSFVACTAENQRCGVLYCNGTNLMEQPVPKWKFMEAADTEVVDIDAGGIYIQTILARLDLTLSGFRDPGMVPNGAECGTGKMCVNAQCRPIAEVTNSSGCPDCNGHGVCASSLLCFCDSGWAPPSCSTPGYGGSITNRPANNIITPESSSAEATSIAALSVTMAAILLHRLVLCL